MGMRAFGRTMLIKHHLRHALLPPMLQVAGPEVGASARLHFSPTPQRSAMMSTAPCASGPWPMIWARNGMMALMSSANPKGGFATRSPAAASGGALPSAMDAEAPVSNWTFSRDRTPAFKNSPAEAAILAGAFAGYQNRTIPLAKRR